MLIKSLKDGRFTDEAFEFIEIRFAQVNEAIKSLLSTEATPVVEQPAEAVEQTKEPVIDVSDLKHTLNNFIYKLNS